MVCVGVSRGAVVDVTAVHLRRRSIRLDPTVKLVGDGSLSYSDRAVHVYADDEGVVHIDAARSDEGLLMRNLRAKGVV
jgi:hypothetical protein